MKIYNEETNLGHLKALCSSLRVAFAFMCAERMLPGYIHFAKREQPGGVTVLTGSIDQLWDDLSGKKLDTGKIEELLEKCLSLVPSDEGALTIERAYANDAVSAVIYTLKARQTGEIEYAAFAGRCAYEAIFYFVEHSAGSRGVTASTYAETQRELQEINSSKLVVDEVLTQEETLRDLSEIQKNPNYKGGLPALRRAAQARAYRLF